MSTENFGTSVPQLPCENKKEEQMERPNAVTILDLIGSKLKDPNFDAHELMRLLTYAMFTLYARMQKLGSTVEEAYIRHRLYQCIDLLRILGRSIIETDKFRRRADVIFWQGEAIHQVIDTITGSFIEAMNQAGLTELQRNTVIRYYRDLTTMKEPRLRRETER